MVHQVDNEIHETKEVFVVKNVVTNLYYKDNNGVEEWKPFPNEQVDQFGTYDGAKTTIEREVQQDGLYVVEKVFVKNIKYQAKPEPETF